MKNFLIVLFLALAYFSIPSSVSAYTNSRLMDDAVFDNVNTMSEQQIRNFINSRPSSCLATSGAIFPEPITYFQYGGNVDAARVIYNSARYSDVNPQVILATLQKEQTLITRTNCFEASGIDSRNKAMGMGCPDGGACPAPAYAGFHQQLMKGTWQLGFNRHRAYGEVGWGGNDNIYYGGQMTRGNFKRCASCETIFYDGYSSPLIDGQSIFMENGATASLYTYTPHLGQAFPGIFEGWFGSVLADAYNYDVLESSLANISVNPGQAIPYNTILIKNTGSETWYPDGNVPAGKYPTRLVMRNYIGTPLADTSDPAWIGNNQLKITDPLGPVPPGGNARFTFKLSTPYQIGRFTLNFVPVVDGVRAMRDINMQFTINSYIPAYQLISVASQPYTLLPNQRAASTVTIKNLSQAPWYADGSVPLGKMPVRLASVGYQGNPFANTYDSAWLGTNNQVRMSTPVVNPGENAIFTFEQIGIFTNTNYSFKFVPVIDGVTSMTNIGMAFTMNSPAPNLSYQIVGATNPPATMPPNSTVSASLTLKNTGNTIWRNEANKIGIGSLRLVMTKPPYRTSKFYNPSDTSWISNNQIVLETPIVNPGENGVFSFTWKAPAEINTYFEPFVPVIDGRVFLPDVGMGFGVRVQN